MKAEEEACLLDRARRLEGDALKTLIAAYGQKIFALVLYLIGGNRDKAYDIAVDSFIEAFRAVFSGGTSPSFLVTLARLSLQKSREVQSLLSADSFVLSHLSPEKKQSLKMVTQALLALPVETRLLLLLRDQLNLRYDDIASLVSVPKGEIKSQMALARMRLREKIGEVLNHPR